MCLCVAVGQQVFRDGAGVTVCACEDGGVGAGGGEGVGELQRCWRQAETPDRLSSPREIAA